MAVTDSLSSILGEKTLLRVYLRTADRAPHTPTCDRIVEATPRTAGLAHGQTVLKGILGLGSRGMVQRSAWSIVEHVPVIVEMVDSGERIASFVANELSAQMTGGMATLERAGVMMYRPRAHAGLNPLNLHGSLKPLSTLPRIQPSDHMTINEDGILLRVFIGDSDRFESRPLYEAIVQKVRELGLAGATVLRGTEGFGANSVVHRTNLLEMSTDLPIVIEIVDTEPKVRSLLPHLERMVQEGMITMEYVMVLLYRHNGGQSPAPPVSDAPIA